MGGITEQPQEQQLPGRTAFRAYVRTDVTEQRMVYCTEATISYSSSNGQWWKRKRKRDMERQTKTVSEKGTLGLNSKSMTPSPIPCPPAAHLGCIPLSTLHTIVRPAASKHIIPLTAVLQSAEGEKEGVDPGRKSCGKGGSAVAEGSGDPGPDRPPRRGTDERKSPSSSEWTKFKCKRTSGRGQPALSALRTTE
ncbi:unnamed protein product [Leuciscus chuanchicus]